MAHVDDLAELAPDLVDDVQHLLLVRRELLVLVAWEDDVVLDLA